MLKWRHTQNIQKHLSIHLGLVKHWQVKWKNTQGVMSSGVRDYNMKYISLLMHKSCSELSSILFLTYFKAKSSAVPQQTPVCMFLSWKEEGWQEEEYGSK